MRTFDIPNSSNIKNVGWSPETAELRITFHSGKTYSYERVGGCTVAAMLFDKSVGGYFDAHIKKQFEGKEMVEGAPVAAGISAAERAILPGTQLDNIDPATQLDSISGDTQLKGVHE